MTGFDIAVMVLVGTSAVVGLLRGFVHEVLSLLAWVVALFAIHDFHGPLTVALLPRLHTESGSAVLAFALLAIVPYALIRLLAGQIGKRSRASLLGPVDRLLGVGFGAVKGTVFAVLGFSVLVLGYDTVWGAGGRPQWMTQSRTYPFINACSDALVKMLGERRAAGEAAARRRAASDTADAK